MENQSLIIVIIFKLTGLYLDIQNQGKGDGDKVIQKRYNNASSQLWKLVLQDDGYYFIINKNSGKYLEVAYNSIADGAKIGQWGPTGYDCQKWILKKEGIN
jgi:ricin B lectin